MFVRIFVNSWLISIGFIFWMIEAAFSLIGQAAIERSQLDRFLFSLTWSLFGRPARDVSQRSWSAIRLIENGG
jgi:hypothetical protein